MINKYIYINQYLLYYSFLQYISSCHIRSLLFASLLFIVVLDINPSDSCSQSTKHLQRFFFIWIVCKFTLQVKINAVCHNQLLYLFSISYCNLLYLVSRQVIELLVVIFQSILMGNTCLQKQMMPAENK